MGIIPHKTPKLKSSSSPNNPQYFFGGFTSENLQSWTYTRPQKIPEVFSIFVPAPATSPNFWGGDGKTRDWSPISQHYSSYHSGWMFSSTADQFLSYLKFYFDRSIQWLSNICKKYIKTFIEMPGDAEKKCQAICGSEQPPCFIHTFINFPHNMQLISLSISISSYPPLLRLDLWTRLKSHY